MAWEVEFTDEFEEWWDDLSEAGQEDVAATVHLLELKGPQLPFPYSSGINGSKHNHMRELRIQHKGDPYRVLYAFDQGGWPFCYLAVTKLAMMIGMTKTFLLQTSSMISIFINWSRRG